MKLNTKVHFDSEDGEIGSPYIFLSLFDGDIGRKYPRETLNEFKERKPFAVENFTPKGLTLNISNSGLVPSDLVMLEYQIVYCTYENHGVADGFQTGSASTIHAMEVKSPDDAYLNIDFVPALSTIPRNITFPKVSFEDDIKNIYFRARVSTIWHSPVDIKDWDFKNDVTVVEAYLKVN